MSRPPAAAGPDHGRTLRYLLVGGFNTAVAYAIGVGLYQSLHPSLPTPLIGLLGNVITISLSYLTQRTLVFRSRAPWFAEYLRCYAVYGATSLLTIALQWALVDGVGLSIWWAQAIVIPVGVVLSYTGHARFTFAGRPHRGG